MSDISCLLVSTGGVRNLRLQLLQITNFWPIWQVVASVNIALIEKELLRGNELARKMGKPGIIAFPVLLAIGAITGYLTYTYFTAAIPQEGIVNSPYRKNLTISTANQSSKTSVHVDESKFSKVVTIRISQGASVQGSQNYDPDSTSAQSGALIKWVNDDSTLHTVTSGKDPSDTDKGKQFDSGYLKPNDQYSVPAANIGKGEHMYFCQLHPYMTGKITVQ